MKTFAIIIPTKNRPEMLKVCLKSLQNQIPESLMSNTFVVDDGSKYDTSILNKSICSTLNVSYIAHQESKGPAVARNTGIDISESEWVIFLDDDVTIDQNWYKNLCTFLKQCSAQCVGIEGKVKPSGKNIWDKEVQNLHGGAYLSCHIIFRRSILVKEHGFDPQFQFEGPYCEDHELAARMLQQGVIIFFPQLSVTHLPRPVNLCRYILHSSIRIRQMLRSEYYFYNKHPDRYHQFRGHTTFIGTALSIFLFNVIHSTRRRSLNQCVRNPIQCIVMIVSALIEQLCIFDIIIIYTYKQLKKIESHFLKHINFTTTNRCWKFSHINAKHFQLKRSLQYLLLFYFIRKPVYNAIPTHKKLSRYSNDSSCRLFLRIDDIFLNKPEAIEQFAKLIKKNSTPILAGILGSEILDSKKWPLIELLSESGAYIAIHGFNHQGTFGPFNSELLQMNTFTFLNNIDPVLRSLKKLNQPCSVLIPPFNAIGREQIIAWSKTCKIICGGPETVRFTDRLYGPLALTTGGWYFPSISPFYSNAGVMISNRVPELLFTIKGPLCLTTHFTHESEDNFRSFINLIKTIRQYVHSWDETAQW